MKKQCLHCGKPLVGRSDKRYCNYSCKNAYHADRLENECSVIKAIDQSLHKNRDILHTLLGNAHKAEVTRETLDRTEFSWDHMTGIYQNKHNKLFRIIYDAAWTESSDQIILIIRKRGGNVDS